MSRSVPPLKTYSHLAGERRIPTEYEIVTSKLLYHPERGFEVAAPAAPWYERYQRHGRLTCKTRACLAFWKPLHVAKGMRPTGVSGLGRCAGPTTRSR